jgi:hypothetical protein
MSFLVRAHPSSLELSPNQDGVPYKLRCVAQYTEVRSHAGSPDVAVLLVHKQIRVVR